MLTLHTSHKAEYLLEHLAQVTKSQCLPSPFDTEIFLIQSQGMERWLSQRLADKFGVWANAQFLFPGKFFNEMAKRIQKTLNTDVFVREQMIWRIEVLLRDLSDPVFAPLSGYLQGDQCEVKRFQLAQQIAQVFDQYQIMRPDMLEAWQQNRCVTDAASEAWQMALWHKLLASLPSGGASLHRGQMWQAVIDYMNHPDHQGNLSALLPKRISVFGISSVPHIFLSFLQGLAKHTQVHIYLMQPCRHYWADITGMKAAKIKLVAQPSDSRSIDDQIQNPLLSLLGQQGREFHQLLIEHGNADWEIDSFDDFSSSQPTALTTLQDRILNNDGQKIEQIDDSIQLVSCHSALREVQVLKDYLLSRLSADPSLELRDMLVMAPDISVYEPFISAVFADPRFRYAVADRSLRSSNDMLDAFIELLLLLSSRFEWSRVLDLLEKPVVYQKLGLDETSLEWIRTWVNQTHIRWGQSAEHKKQLDLPALSQNTWDAGLTQMMQGYAMRGTGIEIEGSIAQAMGGLDYFVRRILFNFSVELQGEKSLTEWHDLFITLLDLVFEENEYQHLTQLRILVKQLTTLPSQERYTLPVLIQWLEVSVGEHKTSQGFLAGQLTFCSMLPMRSIPFKVICILGLNEGVFPKNDRRPSFDLMGGVAHFRKGDRSSRRDDRYQFLDALLSTRSALYLSYVGQSIRSNRDIPPSVVVSELLACFEHPEQLLVKHPLQAFSSRYFMGLPALQTYHHESAKTATAFANRQRELPVWWHDACRIALDVPNTIALTDMIQFFRDPQVYFVQRILGIRFDAVEADTDVVERFGLDNLENYHINQTLLEAELTDNAETISTQLLNRGAWMQGVFGEVTLAQQHADIMPLAALLAEIKSRLGQPSDSQFVEQDVVIDETCTVRIEGWLKHRYERGQLFYRAARLKPKDYIQAWIYHLLGDKPTYLVGYDDDSSPVCKSFAPISREEVTLHLTQLMRVYLAGQSQPSALWLDAAWSFVSPKKDSESEAINALDEAVLGGHNHQKPGERYPVSAEIKLLTRGQSPQVFFNEAFKQSAIRLIKPMLDALAD